MGDWVGWRGVAEGGKDVGKGVDEGWITGLVGLDRVARVAPPSSLAVCGLKLQETNPQKMAESTSTLGINPKALSLNTCPPLIVLDRLSIDLVGSSGSIHPAQELGVPDPLGKNKEVRTPIPLQDLWRNSKEGIMISNFIANKTERIAPVLDLSRT